jgi:predicted small lipoprotein YifL
MLTGLLLAAAMLAACGKTGPLYLPDRGGEVVTRPAPTDAGAPPAETSDGSNSPQTVDSPPGAANPAPEVTAPEDDEDKKKDGATAPPRQ